jgi:hypothetical protein
MFNKYELKEEVYFRAMNRYEKETGIKYWEMSISIDIKLLQKYTNKKRLHDFIRTLQYEMRLMRKEDKYYCNY